MLVYRLDTEEYVRRAVDATSRAYAGLIVVLARTAEARQAHEDLTRDWASFHDITGRHIAVLCPAPRRARDSYIQGEYGRVVESPGLQLNIVDNRSRGGFDRAFFAGLDDRYEGRPGTPEEHWDAWSEATGRCARYFGFAESQLPAILLLSFAERRAVAIRLPEHVPLYQICKRLVSSLEGSFEGIDRAVRELRQLEEQIKRTNDDDFVAADKAFRRWREMVGKLDGQLSQVDGLDGDLVAGVRAGLRDLLDTGSIGQLPEQLLRLHKGARLPVHHSLVWGVLQQVNQGPPRNPSDTRRQAEHNGLRAGVVATEERLAKLVGNLSLADALYYACAELFAGVERQTGKGSSALGGWEVDILEEGGHGPLYMTERRS